VVCLDLQSIVKGDTPPLLLLPDVEDVVQKLNNRGTATYVFVAENLETVGYSLEDVHSVCNLLHIPSHRICRYPDVDSSVSGREKCRVMKEAVLSLKAAFGYSVPIITCLAENYSFEASDHPARAKSNLAKLGEYSESDLVRTLNKTDDNEDLIFNVMCRRSSSVPNNGNSGLNWVVGSYGELLQKL